MSDAGAVHGKLGTVRVVSKRKGGIGPRNDEAVVHVDRKMNPTLGNPHILVNHKDQAARDQCVDAYEVDFRAALKARGAVFAEVCGIAAKVNRGENVALSCWCAPERCHAGIIARTVSDMTGCVYLCLADPQQPEQLSLL